MGQGGWGENPLYLWGGYVPLESISNQGLDVFMSESQPLRESAVRFRNSVHHKVCPSFEWSRYGVIPISKNYSALSNKQLNLKTAINRLTTSHWFVVVQL